MAKNFAKLIGYIIVWVVGISLFLGIVLTGVTNSWGRGGHPIVVACVIGAICLLISYLWSLRKGDTGAADDEIKDNY